MTYETATLGAGCFWGVEYVFRRVPGVTDVAVGFSGGHVPDPSYKLVCYSDTGHAEVARITFDPKKVSFEQLLDVFWAMHDATQVDRQGPDVGNQYRSAIFYENEDQKEVAESSRERAGARFSKPIATEITKLNAFYPAEDYHQAYYEKNGHEPYCHVVPVKELERLGLVAANE
ncbi:MAG: peptide-methionine (S)-S-oxide reductase MsrA [Actinomycetota bacterium]|nr:peptide-methionine (S)-S-oxide reductase MsrA [Actinomycetota bacterium]